MITLKTKISNALRQIKASRLSDAEVADTCDCIISEDVKEHPVMQPQSIIQDASQHSGTQIFNNSGIIEEKYMIILTKYPNGQVYPKIFPVGHRILPKKKAVVKKELQQTELGEEETY